MRPSLHCPLLRRQALGGVRPIALLELCLDVSSGLLLRQNDCDQQAFEERRFPGWLEVTKGKSEPEPGRR